MSFFSDISVFKLTVRSHNIYKNAIRSVKSMQFWLALSWFCGTLCSPIDGVYLRLFQVLFITGKEDVRDIFFFNTIANLWLQFPTSHCGFFLSQVVGEPCRAATRFVVNALKGPFPPNGICDLIRRLVLFDASIFYTNACEKAGLCARDFHRHFKELNPRRISKRS
jgi:hypothetical protein